MGMLVAKPQTAENSMNKQIEVTRVLTSPKRRPIHPVSGCMTAAASMYELTAHVPSELLTPRLPDMDGTDTLTMVMSSISMNEAVAIAAVRNRSLPPRRGGYSNAAAGLGASAPRGPLEPELGPQPRDCAHRPPRPRLPFFQNPRGHLPVAPTVVRP